MGLIQDLVREAWPDGHLFHDGTVHFTYGLAQLTRCRKARTVAIEALWVRPEERQRGRAGDLLLMATKAADSQQIILLLAVRSFENGRYADGPMTNQELSAFYGRFGFLHRHRARFKYPYIRGPK